MKLSDYYMKAPLYIPPFFQNREFGIFKGGMVIRHLFFRDMPALRKYIIEMQPDHVYFSAAKYQYPHNNSLTMQKYWIGSDLVFDIDCDHLTPPTIQEAKKHALKLYSILINDFGFKRLLFVFSGGRGYHIHVQDECIQKCKSDERREIADCFLFEILPGTMNYNEKRIGIDAPVTCDVHRLIRLPGSLHGKTMLPCRIET